MSEVLPPIQELLDEFDGGKVPRSQVWHTLITGLYLNFDNVNEIEGWYNTVQELTAHNQLLAGTVKLQHDQVKIWHGEVDTWQQQVNKNTTLSEQYRDEVKVSETNTANSALASAVSEISSKNSETASANSALASAASAAASKNSEVASTSSASESAASAAASKNSEIASASSASESAASAAASKSSEVASASSESESAASAAASKSSEIASGSSASESSASAAASKSSEVASASSASKSAASAAASKSSEVASGSSASESSASAAASKSSEVASASSASKSVASAAASKSSEIASASSASESAASAAASKNSEIASASSANTASQQAIRSENEADRAKVEADRAKVEANSVTVKEAPIDGKQYVRQNGQWIEVETDNEWRPGDIKMIAGSEDDIQPGWQLCNGVGQTSNGICVPDLRDRFIVCSGSSYTTGTTGGSVTATTNEAGGHSHTVNIGSTTLSVAQMPSHTHSFRYRMYGGNSTDGSPWRISGGGYGGEQLNNATGSSHSHTHSGYCQSVTDHSHTVNVTSPYYALAFIIKL